MPQSSLSLARPAMPAAAASLHSCEVTSANRSLVVVTHNDQELFEFGIAMELFARNRTDLGVPWYVTNTVAARGRRSLGRGGVVIAPTAPLNAIDEAQTIVLPGWPTSGEPAPARLRDKLRSAHARGACLLSICTGAFLLASVGLLDGRRATTHWMHSARFRSLYPAVDFVADVLYVDAGNIITSAGSAAGLDAGIHLIRRDFGPNIANAVARRMVCAPHRDGGQAQYVDTPVPASPQRTLAPVMDWARVTLHEPISVARMADKMAMSERTFLRHFHAAVGMPPAQWLARARIDHARTLLESTVLPLTTVSEQCGYASLETFRVAFRRVMGVAPAGYRKRFSRTTVRNEPA